MRSQNRKMKYKGVEINIYFDAKAGIADITACAPDGMVFAGHDFHEAVCGGFAFEKPQLDRMIEAIKEDIDNGFEKCEIPDCEWCNE